MSAALAAMSRDAMRGSATISSPNVPPPASNPPALNTPALNPPPASTSKTLSVVPSVDLKSLVGWWGTKYILLFVTIFVLLYILQPPFVLESVPPEQEDNAGFTPSCSLRYIFIVSLASVAFAVVAPIVAKNWGWISSSASSAAKSVRSAVAT